MWISLVLRRIIGAPINSRRKKIGNKKSEFGELAILRKLFKK